MTVASAVESEVDLQGFEGHHFCPEMGLDQMHNRNAFAEASAPERR
jgi:hypothetical protein